MIGKASGLAIHAKTVSTCRAERERCALRRAAARRRRRALSASARTRQRRRQIVAAQREQDERRPVKTHDLHEHPEVAAAPTRRGSARLHAAAALEGAPSARRSQRSDSATRRRRAAEPVRVAPCSRRAPVGRGCAGGHRTRRPIARRRCLRQHGVALGDPRRSAPRRCPARRGRPPAARGIRPTSGGRAIIGSCAGRIAGEQRARAGRPEIRPHEADLQDGVDERRGRRPR